MIHSEESLITSIMDAQPDAVFWFIPLFLPHDQSQQPADFELRYCNRAAADMLYSTKDELRKQTLLTTAVLDDASRYLIFDQCKFVWQTGEQKEYTYYSQHIGRYFNVLRSKILDGVISVTRDFTHIVRTEQKLQQQADTLNKILDACINGVFYCEAIRNISGQMIDLRFIQYNKRFLELLHLDEYLVQGKTFLSLFPSARLNGAFELVCQAIETGEHIRKEVYYKGENLDGWYDVSLAKLGNNGLVVTFDDITESKNDKLSIQRSAEYLQHAIDSSQTGITVIVPEYGEEHEIIDFRYRVVNNTFATFIGATPPAMVGGLLSKWFPLYKAQGTFERYKKIFQTGDPQRFDLHYVNEGRDVWVDILAKKNGDEILVTFHDYTPLKKAQLHAEMLINDLRRSNANLEDFAYAASHDLQEPLRKIHFFAEKIKSHYKDNLDDNGRNMFQRMESATQRMRELIDDLLSYSQVDQKSLEETEVDLNDVVADVLNDLETSIQEKKAQVTTDKLPSIRGDKAQLTQLFQNLISNALKYTDPKRTPFISIRCFTVSGRESGFNLPTEELSNKFHLIQVTDNGIGFEQADAEKIFNVFQRLHGRSEYSGTGLGLAIVKKSVDNHGGFIMAEGKKGEGAVFKILLPA